ncbi:MAG: SprT family zinc-dependent metalloprotease [Cyclobacteriaceae bacterium]
MGKKMVVSNIQVDVIKKDIKNMHLAVYPPNGKVRLATPMGVNDDTIRLFTISKLGWIKKQQRKFNEQHRQSSRKYVNRESHYFFGKRYLLKVIEEDRPSRVEIKGKARIELHVKPNSTIEQRHSIMSEWCREELKKVASTIFPKWEKKMGVSIDTWGIRQMKTKWGTCNQESKRIHLNLELSKKPIQCIEYIVVHELVHLFERNHNEQFKAYMDKYLPNWKSIRNDLNRLPVSHVDWEY